MLAPQPNRAFDALSVSDANSEWRTERNVKLMCVLISRADWYLSRMSDVTVVLIGKIISRLGARFAENLDLELPNKPNKQTNSLLVDVFFRCVLSKIPTKFPFERFSRNRFARFKIERNFEALLNSLRNDEFKQAISSRLDLVGYIRLHFAEKKLTDRVVYARPLVCTACFIGLWSCPGLCVWINARLSSTLLPCIINSTFPGF